VVSKLHAVGKAPIFAFEIVANRVQLQQVVMNLLVNAADAMEVVIDRERLLKITSEERSGVLISVEDSGPGVETENIERIFEPFYTTKPNGMGWGSQFAARLWSHAVGG
jgi:C4-dicarboxylate-specific signal transduction histidine kinase